MNIGARNVVTVRMSTSPCSLKLHGLLKFLNCSDVALIYKGFFVGKNPSIAQKYFSRENVANTFEVAESF